MPDGGYPRVYYAQPAKGLAHRALADIRESIRELAYYRQTVFVPQPGPSSEQAAAAAASGDRWPHRHAKLIRFGGLRGRGMVGVAQLVEHLVVVQDVAGSSPVTHPKSKRT